MKPATRSRKRAIFGGVLVGAFSFYWYFIPNFWLGAIMAILSGLFTFYILSTRRMERLRRILFTGLFVLVLVTVIAIVLHMGVNTFISWANIHKKVYYLAGQSLGTVAFPCTREVPNVILRAATYLSGLGLWRATFPSNLGMFLVIMVPYLLTGIIFGRGFCGWICPFGGLSEAFVTGRKERWSLAIFKKLKATRSGYRYAGLKEWVKDTKYGLLVALILLSVALVFPIFCIFCPVLWLEFIPIFWGIIAVLVVFAIILPFMTKRRWWCLVCPMGAVLALLNKISLFRIKMDENQCDKCLDCVEECRMYAMTPNNVEIGKCTSADCIRCGRCIETCPEEAVDIYWIGTSIKVRSTFILLAIIAAVAWYAWFIYILADFFWAF